MMDICREGALQNAALLSYLNIEAAALMPNGLLSPQLIQNPCAVTVY